jgi:hypothetical protein
MPPMVIWTRAPPGALGLDPVDRAAGALHEVSDQLAPTQLRPDHTRTWRRHMILEDALSPLAPRAQRRTSRRHPRQLDRRAIRQLLK